MTKDSWMASFSTAIATTVWNGNHDGSGLSSSSNYVVRKVVSAYMEPVHKELYASEGKWKSGDTWDKPSGIQNLTVNGQKDIWPSWYNSKTSGVTKETLVFNSVNKKKATACTPESLKESIEVSVMTDPVSESKIYSGLPDGYDEKADDDCAYVIPTVAISGYSGGKLVFGAVKGSAGLNSYIVYKKTGNEAEKQVKSGTVKEGTNTVEGIEASAGDTLRVMVTDVNGTSDSATYKVK